MVGAGDVVANLNWVVVLPWTAARAHVSRVRFPRSAAAGADASAGALGQHRERTSVVCVYKSAVGVGCRYCIGYYYAEFGTILLYM